MNSIVTAQDADLVKILTRLNEIGARVNRLGMGHDLTTTLELIATGAVEVVTTGTMSNGSEASAVIWVYDEARQEFDPNYRVSAGEPEETSIDDFPRSDGLGRQAISHRQRLLSYETGAARIHPLKREAGARSLVCHPLIVSDEIVGVLYVYRCNERCFDQIELLLLDNFVHLAGMAIYHGRQVGGLNKALTRKIREMEKLRRASHLISSRTNLDETLQEILAIGLDLTAAQYGSLEFYDKKQDILITKALAGSKERPSNEPPLAVNEHSVVGWVALKRQSVLIADLHDPQWQAIYQPLLTDQKMCSEVAVPLIGGGGQLEGVLNIESPRPDAFTNEDLHLLEALATQAVIAMQEIRLLDAMQEIVEVLLTARVDDLLKLIVERACELINASCGLIWLVSEPDMLVVRQSTDEQRVGDRLPLNGSITGQAISLQQPITIDDVRSHPDFHNRALAVEKEWVSVIVVPLLAPHDNEHPLGSFSLYTVQLRDFSDWDKKLLTCLANHAAVAIRDAEQLAQLKETQERQAIAETFAAVGDVGANLLHQLNNKFGAISVRVQGIEEKCTAALDAWPYLADNLQEIARGAQQAMTIVRDSMAHLRPTRPQPVEALPCVERALRRAKPASTVEISRTGFENLPRVLAGEKQLEMVFYNLIENALTAMDRPGKLHFEGEWHSDEVALTVADSGRGIPLEMQPHIFEFAVAKEQSGKNLAGRLGFGLWWVKTFVDRFGGRVEVKSSPGQGSAFTVWLPAEKGR
jgi:GAF domain-containing protein